MRILIQLDYTAVQVAITGVEISGPKLLILIFDT